ncbi:MAG TPA: glutamate synthase-related protein, partial [Desulfobacteria bacterium]|nr:glutamate synthase-related protein [Desulfobacteria bacterium]
YPKPFGKVTSAAQKEYPVDYSHFNIAGTITGADRSNCDDNAGFTNVNIESAVGADGQIPLRLPIIINGMGSAQIAANNWEHLAVGAAISGVGIVVGENVVGMDPNCEIKDGRVVKSPGLQKRIKVFRDWSEGKGFIAVQANVEDTKLQVHKYALEELGVDAVEIKWGQGAKSIGGEVKINNLEWARELKRRGYQILPDPENLEVQLAFKNRVFVEFERHSRTPAVDEESFHNRIRELRSSGAMFISLKTGAYRASDLARAVKWASDARLDLLTVDGAGGGTGMSPWRMMNEWGIPTLYVQALLNKYLARLAQKGSFVPKVAISGGFVFEDQIFKAVALSSPYVKAVGMARGPLAAVMVGKNVGEVIKAGRVPEEYKRFGDNLEQVFVSVTELKQKYGSDYAKLPLGAIGLFTYFERLGQGLRQLMYGARRMELKSVEKNDIFALTREASDITGIKYILDHDAEEADEIIG